MFPSRRTVDIYVQEGIMGVWTNAIIEFPASDDRL